MRARGGEAKQVTSHTEGYQVHSWFPDGKSLLCTGQRDHHWRDATRLIRVWVDGSRGEEVLADLAATSPSLSPDGTRVLFNREGRRWWRKGYRGAAAAQVWVLDLQSGRTTKLVDEGVDCRWPVWTPEGDAFLFTKGGSEGFDLWRAELPKDVPITSVDPGAIVHERVLDVETHSVVFPAASLRVPTLVYRHGFDLYRWDPKLGAAPEKLSLRVLQEADLPDDTQRRELERADEIAFQRDGLEVAFTAGGDVWVMDTELREPVQVTNTPAHETSPVWGPDGEHLWFVSTSEGQADIYRAERRNRGEYWWRNSEFDVTQVTDDAPTESMLRLAPGAERVLYRRGNGQLWSLDTKSLETTQLLDGFSRPDFDVSPDGKWLAYAAEDDDFNSDVFLTPLDGSAPPYNVSRHPDNDSRPRFSNDGKVLAFTGRRFDQEQDIFYVYLQNGFDEQSDRDRTLERALKKMREERGAPENDDPSKSPEDLPESGEENEEDDDRDAVEPIEIDLDQIEERIRRVTIPNVDEDQLVWVGKGQRLAFSATINGKSGVYTVEFPDDIDPELLTSRKGSDLAWSAEAKALFMVSDGKPTRVDLKGEDTTYKFSAVQEFSRSERFAHAFDVAWRTMRDRWYDERMGGKNWDQVRRRYRGMATESIDSRMFEVVVEMMLGELNGSHLGFTPSDDDGPKRPPHTDRTAHLGIRFQLDHPGPGLKVRDVLPGGPADREGVDIAPADTLLEIDGTQVDPAFDLPSVLNGRPQRDVRLTVQKAAGGTVHEFTVRPTSYSAARRALYEKWIQDARRAVDELSQDRLGYLHIRSMNIESFNEFERQLFAAGHGKAGMIIDVRDNGGGWTTDYLLTAVTQPRHAITVPRGGGEGYPQDRKVFASWHKPIVVLCNQNSFSNAEIFSHAIKTLGRGKLVGVPTAGGVISTGSVRITDVGRMRMPFRGWFVVGSGEDMELNGAVPDEVLWPEPGEIPAGLDRQLRRAVEILTQDVNQEPKGPQLRYAAEQAQ